MIKPRSSVLRIEPYVPGKSAGDLTPTDSGEPIVKLSSNENPFGPSPAAVRAAQQEASNLHIYPDGASTLIKSHLSDRLNIDVNRIIMGCGSDEVIRMLGEAYLGPDSAAVFADTTFSQYIFVTRLMGAKEVVVPLRDGVHDLAGMAQAVNETKAGLVFICNPNNPTGTYVNERDLLAFIDAVPDETLVVVDEAYFEYADAPDFPDVLNLIREGRNIVLLRTFSKAYALAGLRIGYGIGPKEVVSVLERIRPPFNVNRIAETAAIAALADRDHLDTSTDVNQKERQRLTSELVKLGLSPLPSQSNFIWVRLGGLSTPVYEALLEKGIIVRDGVSFGEPEALRVTIGTEQQNTRLISALRTIVTMGLSDKRREIK